MEHSVGVGNLGKIVELSDSLPHATFEYLRCFILILIESDCELFYVFHGLIRGSATQQHGAAAQGGQGQQTGPGERAAGAPGQLSGHDSSLAFKNLLFSATEAKGPTSPALNVWSSCPGVWIIE